MFKNIFVDKSVFLSCAAIAVLIASIIVGSVPYSALASHPVAYAAAALATGIAFAVSFLFLCDRVLFPILDGFFQGVQEALDERRRVAGPVNPFRPKRAGLPARNTAAANRCSCDMCP
jgi:p-aminobenzoyl-glutamate transporter AbgT